MHIGFGGVTSIKERKFSYKGGEIAEDMLIDPDFLTFSIFEDFSSNAEITAGKSNVVKVWYRLPNEDISVARFIYVDKDNEIRKIWSKAKEFGEVYIYVEHNVPDLVAGENLVNEDCLDDGETADDEKGSDEEHREEESEEEDREQESDGQNREDESEEEDREQEGEDEVQADVQSEDDNDILGEGAADSRFENLSD